MEHSKQSIIQRDAGLLADRIEFVPDAWLSTIEGIPSGVFFVMAFWSAPARRAFQRLIEVVLQHDLDARLRIVVVDIEDSSELCKTPPFSTLGGWGETFWIRSGEIAFSSGIGLNSDCIEPNTIALIDSLSGGENTKA